MDNKKIASIVDDQLKKAENHASTVHKIIKENKDAYEANNNILKSLPNRSKATTSEAQDVVEAIFPSIQRVFISGKSVVQFEPRNKEDEDIALQITEYVNWVVTKSNNGEKILNDAFKNSLIFKVGFLKHYWCVEEEYIKDSFEGLSEEEYILLVDQENIDIIQESSEEIEVVDELGNVFMQKTYNVKICTTVKKGRIIIEAVNPLEVFISPQATSLDDCDYCCHVVQKTRSELIEQGFNKNLVFSLSDDRHSSHDSNYIQTENQGYDRDNDSEDKSQDLLKVEEHYIKIDIDNDGVAELTKILKVGSTILTKEKVSDIPFSYLCPIPFPNQFYGHCPVDMVKPIQLVQTSLLRQTLDNVALMNNPTKIINSNNTHKAFLEGLKSNQATSLIQVNGDPNSSIQFKEQQSVAGVTLPMMDYLKSLKEAKTGVTSYSQGLDANSLNKTATGVSKIMDASQMRMESMARAYANQLERFYTQILRIAVEHKEDIKDKVIRLTNRFVEIDSSVWHDQYDTEINIGFGVGDKIHEFQTLSQIYQIQQAEQEGGTNLADDKNRYATLVKLCESVGLKDAEKYFNDPSREEEDGQPKIDPAAEMQAMEMERAAEKEAMEMQLKEAELALKQAELALKEQDLNFKQAIEQQKLNLETSVQLKNAALDADKIAIEESRKEQ